VIRRPPCATFSPGRPKVGRDGLLCHQPQISTRNKTQNRPRKISERGFRRAWAQLKARLLGSWFLFGVVCKILGAELSSA
jgi:hypothetical protein